MVSPEEVGMISIMIYLCDEMELVRYSISKRYATKKYSHDSDSVQTHFYKCTLTYTIYILCLLYTLLHACVMMNSTKCAQLVCIR